MRSSKKIFDFFLSIFLILFFSPLLIIISILIKLESRGPVIFKSLRVGQNNRRFYMFKFRTMKQGTRLIETKKIKNVNRKITKIGKILRKLSLDELPQLFNVIKGEMSIVGPRPAIKSQKSLIKKRSKLKINQLKPGITGLAQINGRDLISEKKKLYFDHIYFKKYDNIFDIIILFKTVLLVISNKDVSH